MTLRVTPPGWADVSGAPPDHCQELTAVRCRPLAARFGAVGLGFELNEGTTESKDGGRFPK